MSMGSCDPSAWEFNCKKPKRKACAEDGEESLNSSLPPTSAKASKEIEDDEQKGIYLVRR